MCVCVFEQHTFEICIFKIYLEYTYICVYIFGIYILEIYMNLEYTRILEKIFLSFLPSSGDLIVLDLQRNNGFSSTVRGYEISEGKRSNYVCAQFCVIPRPGKWTNGLITKA